MTSARHHGWRRARVHRRELMHRAVREQLVHLIVGGDLPDVGREARAVPVAGQIDQGAGHRGAMTSGATFGSRSATRPAGAPMSSRSRATYRSSITARGCSTAGCRSRWSSTPSRRWSCSSSSMLASTVVLTGAAGDGARIEGPQVRIARE